jgi:hypothetical protein
VGTHDPNLPPFGPVTGGHLIINSSTVYTVLSWVLYHTVSFDAPSEPMLCYPSALQGGGGWGDCQPVSHSGQFELSFLSRFRTTGDKYPRNTCSGAEKRNLESVCVCMWCPIYSMLSPRSRLSGTTHKWPHAMPCSENRSICHMLDRYYYSTIIARARLKTPKSTPLLIGFHEW